MSAGDILMHIHSLRTKFAEWMQGIHRVRANLEDTCLDYPDAKHRLAEIAAAAGSSDLGVAFASQGIFRQPTEVAWTPLSDTASYHIWTGVQTPCLILMHLSLAPSMAEQIPRRSHQGTRACDDFVALSRGAMSIGRASAINAASRNSLRMASS